jgi:CubicO group peptidase (beta-lactamase class C family)
VSKYIPEFKDLKVYASGTSGNMQVAPLERDITIRHLLTHTSGLTYGLFSNTPVDSLYLKAEVLSNEGTLKDMIDKLSHIPLLYQPGSTWHYGVSIDVLGYFVEVLSDMPFDQFLAQRIFQPLDMKDTGFYVPEDKVHRFAANYGPDENGGITVIDKPTTSAFAKPTRFFSGGGGLVSTASDYIRFAQMLLNGGELEGTRLLGRKTVEFMMTNHLPEELVVSPGVGFGLGFAVITDVVKTGILGSEGLSFWLGAANTYFWIDPQEELITMVWTQFIPAEYYPLANEFRVLAYQAIVGSVASSSDGTILERTIFWLEETMNSWKLRMRL